MTTKRLGHKLKWVTSPALYGDTLVCGTGTYEHIYHLSFYDLLSTKKYSLIKEGSSEVNSIRVFDPTLFGGFLDGTIKCFTFAPHKHPVHSRLHTPKIYF